MLDGMRMRKKLNPINYISSQDTDYTCALSKCTTLDQLTELLQDYASIFPDALDAIPLNADEFLTFITGLRKERSGQFSGEDFMRRFGLILLPYNLIKVATVAAQFCVSWGCAFIRLQEFGNKK